MSQPRHRANKLQKTRPRIQPAGRHVGVPDESEFDRHVAANAATEFSILDLARAAFGPNPFRGGVR
jgi:hypothetical protein